MIEEVFIRKANCEDGHHLIAFIDLYEEWKEYFLKEQVIQHFCEDDFYFIYKETWENQEHYDSGHEGVLETIGFLTVEYLSEKIRVLEHVWIRESEREKRFATTAIAQTNANYISTIGINERSNEFINYILSLGVLQKVIK
tara:strand:+ start:547 stop:969 length:423 start_codon:yes stop_codon:yes gene_type:complete